MDIGFSAIMAHLVGDYILQNDWMAKNKANPLPEGQKPCSVVIDGGGVSGYTTPGTIEDRDKWNEVMRKWWVGNLACTAHCLAYTLSVFLFCFQWITVGGLIVCFVAHWFMDRFRLARKWMNVSGQKEFATGGLSPWSIVIVDNTIHLLTLYLIFVLWS